MSGINLYRSLLLYTILMTWDAIVPRWTSGAFSAKSGDGETAMPMSAPLDKKVSTTVTIVSAMARATTVDVILMDQSGRDITGAYKRSLPPDCFKLIGVMRLLKKT